MRKLLATWVLMSLCSTAYSQVEVWACQAQASAGLKWEANRWSSTTFVERSYLIRLDGENSTYGSGEVQYATACSKSGTTVRCNDSTGGTIILNTETGTGGISELLGAVITGAQRDTLSVTAVQCTKF